MLAACGKAESNWYKLSQRWGLRTVEAINANKEQLQFIIDDVWPDISFGYGQRIVLYHYYGTREPTVDNCLAVRDYVWSHSEFDILQMAQRLQSNYISAGYADLSPVQGDRLLMALVAYNSGSCPSPDNTYWVRYAANVEGYKQALVWSRA